MRHARHAMGPRGRDGSREHPAEKGMGKGLGKGAGKGGCTFFSCMARRRKRRSQLESGVAFMAGPGRERAPRARVMMRGEHARHHRAPRVPAPRARLLREGERARQRILCRRCPNPLRSSLLFPLTELNLRRLGFALFPPVLSLPTRA